MTPNLGFHVILKKIFPVHDRNVLPSNFWTNTEQRQVLDINRVNCSFQNELL